MALRTWIGRLRGRGDAPTEAEGGAAPGQTVEEPPLSPPPGQLPEPAPPTGAPTLPAPPAPDIPLAPLPGDPPPFTAPKPLERLVAAPTPAPQDHAALEGRWRDGADPAVPPRDDAAALRQAEAVTEPDLFATRAELGGETASLPGAGAAAAPRGGWFARFRARPAVSEPSPAPPTPSEVEHPRTREDETPATGTGTGPAFLEALTPTQADPDSGGTLAEPTSRPGWFARFRAQPPVSEPAPPPPSAPEAEPAPPTERDRSAVGTDTSPTVTEPPDPATIAEDAGAAEPDQDARPGWFARFRARPAVTEPAIEPEPPAPATDAGADQAAAQPPLAPQPEADAGGTEAEPATRPGWFARLRARPAPDEPPAPAEADADSGLAQPAELDTPPDEAPVEAEPAPARAGWFSRLKAGLARSTARLTESVTTLFARRRLDDAALEELEDTLIAADLGVAAAMRIVEDFRTTRFGREVSEEEIKGALADAITEILEPVALPMEIEPANAPHVVLVVGVNGTGKTTTIAKLGQQYRAQGLSCAFVAGDTFRAAAVEQLQIWGERTGCPVHAPAKDGADAAGLAFDALKAAREAGTQVLLIDTAGRLHNKTALMDELRKIIRVIQRVDPSAPHSVLLTLDATTGQNALQQCRVFKEMVDVTGLAVTKLDGSAKGGVVVALAQELVLPLHMVGVGEQADDLRPFTAREFARGLVGLD